MTLRDLKTGGKRVVSKLFKAGLIACVAVGLAIFSFSIHNPFSVKAAGGNVTVTPGSWTAGATKVGTTSATSQVFVINNNDTASETLTINRSGSGDFQVDNTGVSGPLCALGLNTIPGSNTCSIRFVFKPSTVNASITAQLVLNGTPDVPTPTSINLYGAGYNNPTVVLTSDSPSHLAVANTASLDQTYTYTNNSDAPVTLNQPAPVSSGIGTYSINLGSCGNSVAAYGGQCTFTASFLPGSTGGDTLANFTLTTTPATTAPKFSIADSTVVLPTMPVNAFSFSRTIGQPLDANSSKPVQVVNNDAGHTVTLSSSVGTPNFSVTNCGPIAAGSSCNLTVNFNPAAVGNYTDTLVTNFVINTANGSYDSIPNDISLQASLQGTANAPGPTPTPTPTATATPTNTPTNTPQPTNTPGTPHPGSGGGNTIGGLVTVDDQPVSGFSVKIDGADTREGITGDNGRYNFDNLPTGTYTVILTYDHNKYKAISQDRYTQTLTGGEIEKGINFRLQAIATTEPTTPAETTAPVVTTAPATTQAPVSPNPTTGPTTGPAPSCPDVGPGRYLRLATKTTQQGSNEFFICIKVIAGNNGVDLNHTVVVHLPQGVSVGQTQVGTGTVNVNGNKVEWGGYSLAAQQSTTLLVEVTSPSGNLNGTNIVISGRFNRGQAFQQTIDGLPPLVEIPETEAVAATPVRPVGGQGGGDQGTSSNPVIPAAPPATGTGTTSTGNDLEPLMLLGLLIVLSATLGGLVLRRAAGRKAR